MTLLKTSQSKPRAGQVPKPMAESNPIQLTVTWTTHLLCPVYTSAVSYHGSSESDRTALTSSTNKDSPFPDDLS